MIRVLQHQRCPGPGRFSLERVFTEVRAWLPADIDAAVATCAYESRGLFRRAFNTLSAGRRNAEVEVHHVLGDVHYLVLGLEPRRTVLTVADCAVLHRATGIRRFLLWAFWYYLPIRRARIVTAISEYTRGELIRYVRCDPAKIRTIHCPVPSIFAFVPSVHRASHPIILQVGTGPTKNLDRVVEALKSMRCCLWIVGHLNDAQKRRLEPFGIPYRNFPEVSDADLVRLYVQSDIVIFASTYEGFGLPILEAQSVGRPVIASNRASVPEVAGDAAEYVDPDDDRGIRDAVARLVSDTTLRDRLVTLGRENVKRFEPSRIAESYASIYREIAKR